MRARVLVGVLLLAVGLTACSDDEPPAGTLPTLSATPSESAAPGDVPAEAREATPEGAAEFVRFFYEQVESAYASRDPEVIRSLATPDCETCQAVIGSIERLRDEDLTVSGYAVDVVDVAAPGDAAAEKINVTTTLKFSEYVERDADGNAVVQEPAVDAFVQDVALQRQGSAWRVAAVING